MDIPKSTPEMGIWDVLRSLDPKCSRDPAGSFTLPATHFLQCLAQKARKGGKRIGNPCRGLPLEEGNPTQRGLKRETPAPKNPPNFPGANKQRSGSSFLGFQRFLAGSGLRASEPCAGQADRLRSSSPKLPFALQGSGCIVHLNIATCRWWFPLYFGGADFHFGVEKATCFKWLRNVSSNQPCLSPLEKTSRDRFPLKPTREDNTCSQANGRTPETNAKPSQDSKRPLRDCPKTPLQSNPSQLPFLVSL